MESQANQSYANLLTSAQPPAEHSSPKLLLNTALAVFLGALLAVWVGVSAAHRGAVWSPA